MDIKQLDKRPDIQKDKKLQKNFDHCEKLIDELQKREIPSEIVSSLNWNIEEVNSFSGSNKGLRKQIRKSQSNIFKLLEKKLNIVPENFYRTRWLAIGMTVFGAPLGVVFGTGFGNMGFLGIGIPMGMVIGMAIGAGMDKKAFEEGRQLDLELNC